MLTKISSAIWRHCATMCYILTWPNPIYSGIYTRHPSPVPCRIYASVNWISIGSLDNALSPTYSTTSHYMDQCSLIVYCHWTLRNNLPSEIRIKVHDFSFMKIHMKISSVKWRPFCPGGRWGDRVWFRLWQQGRRLISLNTIDILYDQAYLPLAKFSKESENKNILIQYWARALEAIQVILDDKPSKNNSITMTS